MTPACADVREEISADLDGESDADGRAAIETHLDGCRACRAWRDDAVLVTRTVRTGPADVGPDLVALVLPAAPRVPVGPRVARLALAVVGVVQTVLGILALVGTGDHGTGDLLGAGMAHLGHETGAWNVAVGVAFLAGARWTRQLAGLLPLLGTFVVVLGILSTVDLVAGRVEPARVLAHGLVVVGVLLAAYARRATPVPAPSPEAPSPDAGRPLGAAPDTTPARGDWRRDAA